MTDTADIILLPASQFPGPPPWHFQCRTVLAPITKSWDELAKEAGASEEVQKALAAVGDVPDGTRASMDGQVAASQDYESWLKTKPTAFQKEVLGKGRYDLWKSGKAPLDSMIDQTGRPLTLAQLKAKVLPESTLPASSSGAESWHGYPMTALLRQLGSKGVNAQQARMIMTAVGLNPTQSTIYNQVGQGKKGVNIPEMFPDHVAELDSLIEQAKNGTLKFDAPAITPAPIHDPAPFQPELAVTQPKVGVPAFPDNVQSLKVVRKLGGTTGAELVEDSFGNQFVQKKGASAEHLMEEFYAEQAYRAAGVPVPESRVYNTPSGPVKLAQFVDGRSLASLTGVERKFAEQQLQKHFAVDALLGNWDVIGTDSDNILLGKDGVAYRIDVGGSLRYRAQGTKKTDEQWNGYATELWTMRDSSLLPSGLSNSAPAKNNQKIYSGINYADITAQVKQLEGKRMQMLSAVPPELRDTLQKRLDNLQHIATASQRLMDDKYLPEYADQFSKHAMQMRARGIIDRLPKQLTGTSAASVELHDENGLEFGGLRGPGTPLVDVEAYIKELGGNWSYINQWASAQSGNSHTSMSESLRYWMATKRSVPLDNYYWTSKSSEKAKQIHSATATDKAGYDKTMAAFHAFQYEFFDSTWMPNVNQKTGTIRLLRTEASDVMSKYQLKVGDVKVFKRGMDSTSLTRTVSVKGSHLTVTDAPIHRAFGTWVFTKKPGSYGGFFLGDSENEIFAMLEGLPAVIVDNKGDAGKFHQPSPPLPLAKTITSQPKYGSSTPTVVKVQTYAEKLAQAKIESSFMSAKNMLGDSEIKFQTLTGDAGSLQQFQSYKAKGGSADNYADFVGSYFTKNSAGGYVTKGSKPVAAKVDIDSLAAAVKADAMKAAGESMLEGAKFLSEPSNAAQQKIVHEYYKSQGGKQNFYKWKLTNAKLTGQELVDKFKLPGSKTEAVLEAAIPVGSIPAASTPTATKPADPSVLTAKKPISSKTKLKDLPEELKASVIGSMEEMFADDGEQQTAKEIEAKYGNDTFEDLHPGHVEAVKKYNSALANQQQQDAPIALPPAPAKPLPSTAGAFESAAGAKTLEAVRQAYGDKHIKLDAEQTPSEAWSSYKAQGGKIKTWVEFSDTYLENVGGVTKVKATKPQPESVKSDAGKKPLNQHTKEVQQAFYQQVIQKGMASTYPTLESYLKTYGDFDFDPAFLPTPGFKIQKLNKYSVEDQKKFWENAKKLDPNGFTASLSLGEFVEAYGDMQFDQAVLSQPAPVKPPPVVFNVPKLDFSTKTATAAPVLEYSLQVGKATKLQNLFTIKKFLNDPVTPVSAGGSVIGSADNFNKYQAKGGVIKTYTDYLKTYFNSENGKLALKLPASKAPNKPVAADLDV